MITCISLGCGAVSAGRRRLGKTVLAGCWAAAGLAVALAAAEPVGLLPLTNKQLADRLAKLGRNDSRIVRVQSAVRSIARNDIWLAELGSGKEAERRRRPALLVVGGIEGDDLAGSAIALHWLERLATEYEKDDNIKKLLDTTTLYVVPRLNPDAAERFFGHPKTETQTSLLPVDDDRDGLTNEDGPEDLNKDDLITSLRIKDPAGEFILDPKDPRLLLKADRARGEIGEWRLLTEGIDNDKDEAWNEDGPGGVNFNRNFPFEYRPFAPDAGKYQVSELETKWLADFVVEHPNIAAVFTFGGPDNLVQTPKGEAGGKRPATALHEGDLPVYRELGKAWRKAIGLNKELTGSSRPGAFADYMYFDRGRLSLTACAWTPAIQIAVAKKSAPETEKKQGEETAVKEKQVEENKGEADKRNEDERAFLRWLDENAPDRFIPWKEIAHPDFPNKKVEVGGFVPFAKTVPPPKILAELADQQSAFLTDLAGKLPRIGFRKAEAKPLGEGVYEIKVELENTGYLPTALAQGEIVREVHPTRVRIEADDPAILGGTRTVRLGTIPGSGSAKEVTWIVRAMKRKQIEIEAESMLGGIVRITVDLK